MAVHEAGIRLRPMGLGDLVDESIALYRQRFLTWVVATAIVQVPSVAVSLLLNLVSESPPGLGPTPLLDETEVMLAWSLAMLAWFLAVLLMMALISVLGGGATVQLASDAILGRPLEIGAAYRAALRRLPSLLWATFLFWLACVPLGMTVIGIPFAIYLFLGWSLYFQPIMVEGVGGRAALSRSSSLVKGHRWRLLGLLIVTGILVVILTMLPYYVVDWLLRGYLGASELGSASGALISIAGWLVSVIMGSLFGAISAIAATLFYYDLRVRKEAFDLERRAGPLQGGQATANAS